MTEGSTATGVAVVVDTELPAGHPDTVADLDRWGALAEAALATEGVRVGELTLTFIDVDAMTELNEAHMDGTGPTDVLAFPIDGEAVGGVLDIAALDPAPASQGTGADEVPLLLGDVVICPAVARANAAEHGRSTDDEIALLVVHGVLHVLGHDHQDVDDTARMRAREQALLAAHHQ